MRRSLAHGTGGDVVEIAGVNDHPVEQGLVDGNDDLLIDQRFQYFQCVIASHGVGDRPIRKQKVVELR